MNTAATPGFMVGMATSAADDPLPDRTTPNDAAIKISRIERCWLSVGIILHSLDPVRDRDTAGSSPHFQGLNDEGGEECNVVQGKGAVRRNEVEVALAQLGRIDVVKRDGVRGIHAVEHH